MIMRALPGPLVGGAKVLAGSPRLSGRDWLVNAVSRLTFGAPDAHTTAVEAASWPDTLHALAERCRLRRAHEAELGARRQMRREAGAESSRR